MSRIGNLPIEVPKDVEISINASTVTVKGKKGSLTQSFNPDLGIKKRRK